jgi:hypothetical protein
MQRLTGDAGAGETAPDVHRSVDVSNPARGLRGPVAAWTSRLFG